MNTLTKPLFLPLLGLLGLGAQSLLIAQSTPNSANDDEDVFELSPFVVDGAGDVGYQSTNTVSATRLNENLKNLPMSIEVINREMMDDLGIDDIAGAVEFANGAQVTQGSEDLQREANIRGLTTRFQRRNQFIWYNPSDSFNISRVEVIRGPSALLYGQGEPGGLINFTTNRAYFDSNSGSVEGRIGSDSDYRVELDQNVAVGDFAARVDLVYQDQGDWRPNASKEFEGQYLTLSYRLKNIDLRAEYENAERVDEGQITPALRIEGASLYATRPDLLNNPAVGNGILEYENLQSWSGSDRSTERSWDSWGVFADGRFLDNSLNVEVAYNVQNQDTSQMAFQGVNDLLMDAAGYYVQSRREQGNSANEVKTTRATASYLFEAGPSKNNLILGYVHRTDWFELINSQELADNGNPTGGARRPFFRQNIADGFDYSYPDASGFVWKPSFTIRNEEVTDSAFLALSTKWFEGKVHGVFGLREDELEKTNLLNGSSQFATKQQSKNAGLVYFFNENWNAYANYSESFKAPGAFRTDPDNVVMPPAIGSGVEFGLKYDFLDGKVSGLATVFDATLEGEDFNLNSVGARNLVDPDGLNGRNGGFFVPSDSGSKGFELQLRANPTEQLTLSFGYAHIDASVSEDIGWQANWNDGFLAGPGGNPVNAAGDPLIISVDGVTRAATLADIALDANGFVANAGQVGVDASGAPVFLVGNGVTGAKVNQVTGQPTPVIDVVSAGEKTSPYSEDSMNFVANYRFGEGAMKGWNLGGSVRFRFNNIAGYSGSQLAGNRQIRYFDDYTVVGLFFGYSRTLNDDLKWKSQVNINNVFDEKYEEGVWAASRLGAPMAVSWTNSLRW